MLLTITLSSLAIQCGEVGAESGGNTSVDADGTRGSEVSLTAVYVGNVMVDLAWSKWDNQNFSYYRISRNESIIGIIMNRNTISFRDHENLTKGGDYTYVLEVMDDQEVVVGNGTLSVTLGEIRGIITQETTWIAMTSPFDLTGEITVQSGGKLTIENGVRVNSGSNGIVVTGALSPVEDVTFNGNGITLRDISNVSLRNCVFTGNTAPENSVGIHVIGSDHISINDTDVHGYGGPDGSGIVVEGSTNIVIKDNVIEDNGGSGIRLSDSSETQIMGNSVTGNLIGVSLMKNTTSTEIGGSDLGDRNIISGNEEVGVSINGNAHNNIVGGNYIGTGKSGYTKLPNGIGILIDDGESNIIGALYGRGGMNVISGNKECGVKISDSLQSARNNTIAGNYIGTNKDGMVKLLDQDQKYGIYLSGVSNNIIGGTSDEEKNIISGNLETGITLDSGSDGNNILGNYIGTDRFGMNAIPNKIGITIGGGDLNIIGEGKGVGRGVGKENVISGNSEIGIKINMSDGNYPEKNEIKGNLIGTRIDHQALASQDQQFGIVLEDGTENIIGGPGENEMNIIGGNNNAGIKISGWDTRFNVVEKNTIKENTMGIDLDKTGSNTIHDNVISSNGIGINLSRTTNNLVDLNELLINCIGISATGNRDRISNNTLSNGTCSSTSILLDNSTSLIIGNTIAGDVGDGIKCVNGSTPLIIYNSFYENSGYDLLNTDQSVPIKARFNWWGFEGSQGYVHGNVDTSNPLGSSAERVDVLELDGNGEILLLDGTLGIEYSFSSPVLLTAASLPPPPDSFNYNYRGYEFWITVNNTDVISKLEVRMYYKDDEIQGGLDAYLEPRWTKGGIW